MAQWIFPPVSAVIAGGATEAKQDTIIVELNSINTDMDTLVAVDYATSAKQDTLIAVDYATQTTLAALLTELQLKADLTETQPVSAASLPLPSGAATEAKQDDIITQVTRLSPVDFLDSGVVDSSSSNIPAAGLTVVASLAAECYEVEIIEDIGEFMTITDGSDVVLAYLPLGGGKIKLNIAASTEIKLASVSGSTISLGKICINFLG